MMKKLKFVLCAMLSLFIFGGVLFVCASNEYVATLSVNVKSGGEQEWKNLTAKYAYASVMTGPTSITSGIKKTTIYGYNSDAGIILSRKEGTTPISDTMCHFVDLGSLGSGKWVIGVRAASPVENYAGWSGTLNVQSYSNWA